MSNNVLLSLYPIEMKILFFAVFLAEVFFIVTSVESEEIAYDNLIYHDRIYYKEFPSILFSGDTKGLVEAELINGIYSGSYTQYYRSGQIRLRGRYKNGKKEGFWVSYHNNGQLHSEGYYVQGLWEGIWIDYYSNGNVRSKGIYKSGKKLLNTK